MNPHVTIGHRTISRGRYIEVVPTGGDYYIFRSDTRSLASVYDHWVTGDDIESYFEGKSPVDWLIGQFPILIAYLHEGTVYIPRLTQSGDRFWKEEMPVELAQANDREAIVRALNDTIKRGPYRTEAQPKPGHWTFTLLRPAVGNTDDFHKTALGWILSSGSNELEIIPARWNDRVRWNDHGGFAEEEDDISQLPKDTPTLELAERLVEMIQEASKSVEQTQA